MKCIAVHRRGCWLIDRNQNNNNNLGIRGEEGRRGGNGGRLMRITPVKYICGGLLLLPPSPLLLYAAAH